MQFETLTVGLMSEMMERLAQGCGPTMMCDSLGIPRSSYYHWMKEGEKPDNQPFTDFRTAVVQAKADYLLSCVKDIKKAGHKQWQANAWLLERKDPKNFSEKHQCKEYPEKLRGMPLEKQGDMIYGMMLKGEISQHEAHMFVEILKGLAQVEENTKLKEQLFEIQQKLENK